MSPDRNCVSSNDLETKKRTVETPSFTITIYIQLAYYLKTASKISTRPGLSNKPVYSKTKIPFLHPIDKSWSWNSRSWKTKLIDNKIHYSTSLLSPAKKELGRVAWKRSESVLDLESVSRLREAAHDLLSVSRNDADPRHHMAFNRNVVTSIDLETKKRIVETLLSPITISI